MIDRLEANNGEVCENLYFLGKRSITKTSEGIRIVSLGGLLDASVTVGQLKDKYLPFHTEGDARGLHGANRADILITSTWPAAVQAGSKVAAPSDTDLVEEQCVADLCAKLQPRYHFSTTMESFYEREPFYHRAEEATPDQKRLTRFISLASATSTSKAKWLYAFSIEPNAAIPTSIPVGATSSPFKVRQKRPALEDQSQGFARYSTDTGSHKNHKSKRRKNAAPLPGPAECFFCLSNPNLSTHLITSIGTDAYLTTAKGPLTNADTFPGLKMPGHILLIPLTHAPNLAAITDSSAQKSTYTELQRYRTALNSMVKEQAQSKLGSVTWEISRNRGVHFHWQYLPVPIMTIKKNLVEAAFKVEAENEKYPSVQRRDLEDGVGEGEYFRVWIWRPLSGTASEDEKNPDGSETQFVIPLNPDIRFDIQFGRRVMGKLLGLEKRLDWKDCVQSDEVESAEAERFKEIFKIHDFSLED